MDLRQKHWAIITVGVLVLCFAVLAAYFLLGSDTVNGPASQTATSTLPQPAPAAATTLHLSEHTAHYDIDLTYPSATPLAATNPTADVAAVAAMKAAMQDIATQFKNNFAANVPVNDLVAPGSSDTRKEALSSEYKIYTGARTVSYVFSIYEDTLGAHPNLYFRTFTFDTATGQELRLKDLFSPSTNYLSILSARARSDLPAIIKRMSGSSADIDYLQIGTKPVAENFQAFYVQGKDLVLIFPPYQVGPYALGTVLDPIPLAQLGISLKAEYR